MSTGSSINAGSSGTGSSAFAVQVGSQKLQGWTRINVTTGIEQLCGSFDVSAADRWAMNGQTLPLRCNQPVKVTIHGTPVITGFVDVIESSYAPAAHDLSVKGRDATGDLVDSAAISAGFYWWGRSLAQIATDLCKPFGIKVTVDSQCAADANAPFQFNQLQLGETIQVALQRLGRIRGCLITSTNTGGLRITRAGNARATRVLELGTTIISAQAQASVVERFHTYRVIAQWLSVENLNTTVYGDCTDKGARAGRITLIDAIEGMTPSQAMTYAQWAASVRAASGTRAEFAVRGWLDGSVPWRPNTLVQIKDPWTRFTGLYLICGVRFTLDDEGGELAYLTCAPKGAYELIATREPNASLELGATS